MMDIAPQFTLRMEADVKTMQFRMAQFVDVELAKQKERLQAIAEKVVADFDFEKEVREAFEYAARSRIQDFLRVECGQRAAEILRKFDIKITITPKAPAPSGAAPKGLDGGAR
jgi:hypothetical protein